VIIDHGAVPRASVDVLVPKGGVVGADLMDSAKPKLIQQFGIGPAGRGPGGGPRPGHPGPQRPRGGWR
jgi:hypothetical protein